MASDKILMKYAMKNDKKEELFHSSGYAQVQSGAGMGSGASGIDVAKREAFDQQRKMIKGYHNSKLMQGVRGVEHARKFVPRTEGGAGALAGAGVGSSADSARIGRGDEAVRGGQVAMDGERSATGMRGGTPRGAGPIARGGERNR